MRAPLILLIVVLFIAAPFLIAYLAVRATEWENSRRRRLEGSGSRWSATTRLNVLTLILSVLTISATLWKYGGIWRWGILVLVVTLAAILINGRRSKARQGKSEGSAGGFDSIEPESLSVSDGGSVGDA